MVKNICLLIGLFFLNSIYAQNSTGVLNTTIIVKKTDSVLKFADIFIKHVPSGTVYKSKSNNLGKCIINGLRVGGPYRIDVLHVGYKKTIIEDVYIQLGEVTKLQILMEDSNFSLDAIQLNNNAFFSKIKKDNMGVNTYISSFYLKNLPTISRNITDFTRLSPPSFGTSFSGQDERAINFSLDGSIYNNAFGLGALNGSQTKSPAISLDAIEEIQISLSPYNLKYTGFVGGNINAVTKSGTNNFHGTGFYNLRNYYLIGNKNAEGNVLNVAGYKVQQAGFSFSGAIIKNKLFYFLNVEGEQNFEPSDFYTKLLYNSTQDKDLKDLSTYLLKNFNYKTGDVGYYKYYGENYKFLLKLDWNINDKNKFSFRANRLQSKKDAQMDDYTALTFSRNNTTSISYQNSNYTVHNDLNSFVAQLHTQMQPNMYNEMVVGYSENKDYSEIKGTPFPTVDILDGGGNNYISFGVNPRSPDNLTNTRTIQLADNFSYLINKHSLSAGLNVENFYFKNQYDLYQYGNYTFNNLTDFFTAANAYLSNKNRAISPVYLTAYKLGYNNVLAGSPWFAETKATNIGFYIQDEYEVNKKLNLQFGVRIDIPSYDNTGTENTQINNYLFKDELGKSIKLSTSAFPTTKYMINPRVGFRYYLNEENTTKLHGGFGWFTGRPPFAFISYQASTNGVISGQIEKYYTNQFPFTPVIPQPFKPASNPLNSSLPAEYNIGTTDVGLNSPQIFRTNLGVEHIAPNGIILSAEILFTQNIKALFYYNANLKPATANFNGIDNRLRYGLINSNPTQDVNANSNNTSLVRINANITDAQVLKTGVYGGSGQLTLKIEKPNVNKGLSWFLAYNLGETTDLGNPWNGNKTVNGNNLSALSFSDYDIRNRIIGNINYRFMLSKKKDIQFSLFVESRNQGRFSYVYAGDMNGDGVYYNDLLFVPLQARDLNFIPYTIQGKTYSVAAQQEAFDAYINQDDYLNKNKGKYTDRNGLLMPLITRVDLSIKLGFLLNKKNPYNKLEFRVDILNIGNLIDPSFGTSYIVNQTAILTPQGINQRGEPVYTFNQLNGSLNYTTYRKGNTINDVWQGQVGVRYNF
ncbi:MAG: hypothetical protein ORN58_00880 [Sediminibacterium sp.]|nr:hypothetical protein [Sediminibacterium sp.]